MADNDNTRSTDRDASTADLAQLEQPRRIAAIYVVLVLIIVVSVMFLIQTNSAKNNIKKIEQQSLDEVAVVASDSEQAATEARLEVAKLGGDAEAKCATQKLIFHPRLHRHHLLAHSQLVRGHGLCSWRHERELRVLLLVVDDEKQLLLLAPPRVLHAFGHCRRRVENRIKCNRASCFVFPLLVEMCIELLQRVAVAFPRRWRGCRRGVQRLLRPKEHNSDEQNSTKHEKREPVVHAIFIHAQKNLRAKST